MDKYLGSNQKFMLLVEGHKISFDDFVNDNSAKDVQPITAEEIKDIVHDIDLILEDENVKLSGKDVRAIVVLSQMNLHIWHNESEARKGNNAGENLLLTHGLNGIRNTSKNIIQENVGGRKDYKIDCIAAEFKDWDVSW